MNKLKIFLEKYNISWRFTKFLFVGALNTLFGYGVFAVFNYLNFHYTLSTLLATILGILFNFKTTGIIVFKNNDNKLLIRFISVYVFMYFFAILELKVFTLFNFHNMYLNYAIILLPNALMSYILMKHFVFMNKDKNNDLPNVKKQV